MIRGIVILSLMAFSGGAYAEESATSSEHEFSGKIEVGSEKVTGNTNTSSDEGTVELGYVYQAWESELYLKGIQETDDGTVVTDYYEAWFKQKYNFENQFYALLLLKYREDFFSGIHTEVTQIIGGGYHAFTEIPDYGLDIEIGYGTRDTKKLINGVIRPNIDHDPGTHIGLSGKYLFTERNTITADITIEAGNDDDFIQKELAWEYMLTNVLSLNYSYESRTFSDPEIGKVGTDAKTSAKIGYEF